jgi:hypothetical protein
MSYSELQSQELNAQIEKINNLVSKYVGEIQILNNDKPIADCIPGTLCYAQKITEELRDEYLAALEKVKNSPNKLREAEKNYITNTQGDYGYHQLLLQRATKIANDEAIKLFNIEITEDEFNQTALGYSASLLRNYGISNPEFAWVEEFTEKQKKEQRFMDKVRELAIQRAVVNQVKNVVTVVEQKTTVEGFYDMIKQHNHQHHH